MTLCELFTPSFTVGFMHVGLGSSGPTSSVVCLGGGLNEGVLLNFTAERLRQCVDSLALTGKCDKITLVCMPTPGPMKSLKKFLRVLQGKALVTRGEGFKVMKIREC